MTSEPIDSKRFLQDLRERRAALAKELEALDSVIGGIEQMSKLGVALPGIPVKGHDQEIQKNTFSAYKPKQATLRYLAMTKRRTPTSDIFLALANGGVRSKSDNLYSIIYTALSRLEQQGMVRRFKGARGVEWDLVGDVAE